MTFRLNALLFAALCAPPAAAYPQYAKQAQSTEKPAKEPKAPAARESITSAALGTTAPEASDTGRPYRLYATLSQHLGAGTFVQDSYARNPDYGYSIVVGGSYRLMKLWDGSLRANAGIGFSQSLSKTAYQGGTRAREFYLHNLRLGLSGRGLLKEPVTDIVFGLGTSVALPTSKQSLTAHRWVRWSLTGNAARNFKDVGPGSLMLRLSLGLRKDFGDAVLVDRSDRAICRSGECLLGIAGNNWSFGPTLSAAYTIDRFSLSVSLGTSHAFRYSMADSDTSAVGYDVRRSDNAQNVSSYSMMTQASIALGYGLNDYVAFTLGLNTTQPYDIQNSDGSRSLRFPFFDFQSTQRNYSSFFLDVDFSY